MMEYDLLLVLGYFRSAAAYLSVIRHLSPHLRIGLLPLPIDQQFLAKNQRAQTTFLTLCKQFGADIIVPGTPVRANLMLVQHFPFPAESIAQLLAAVKTKCKIGMLPLAMAGTDEYDSIIEPLALSKVYVPSKRFADFLLQRRNKTERYAGINMVEVGLPFARYPIFPDFQADYLIASPTTFSFHTEQGKWSFLITVLNLIEQIPRNEIIVYKSHNSMKRDYFAPFYYYLFSHLFYKFIINTRNHNFKFYLDRIKNNKHVEKIITSALHIKILKRALPLNKITPFHEMSLEAFLPGVRKGVIGGLSNTIWGSLYYNLPFYNCVDSSLRKEKSQLAKRDSSKFLDLNLEFFNVPYCEGLLNKGATSAEIVTENERKGDLLQTLCKDIEAVRCAT